MALCATRLYELDLIARRGRSAAQNATLTTESFRIVPEIALFGSDDWWKAVFDGRIPIHAVRGTISRLFMTGHRDWPEFEVDAQGSKSSWTREGDQTLYAEGKEVRVEFVWQRWRSPDVGVAKRVVRVLVRA